MKRKGMMAALMIAALILPAVPALAGPAGGDPVIQIVTGPSGARTITTTLAATGPGLQNLKNQNILIVNSAPGWVEQDGTWIEERSGVWAYVNNGVRYQNRWACIFNPYARTGDGQRQYDWFYFDNDGHLKTGWFADQGGLVYYLNPLSDGTKGRMVTGWAQIDGYLYYFDNVEGSGRMGALYRNSRTPDGHYVDEQGRMRY